MEIPENWNFSGTKFSIETEMWNLGSPSSSEKEQRMTKRRDYWYLLLLSYVFLFLFFSIWDLILHHSLSLQLTIHGRRTSSKFTKIMIWSGITMIIFAITVRINLSFGINSGSHTISLRFQRCLQEKTPCMAAYAATPYTIPRGR